ncbi:MAG TPA: lamin tail domain-containing protein, partial [Patescibacteria group bacterium]|nr:lamin tail domain-containing protein [Patescibacteria group bacterium]
SSFFADKETSQNNVLQAAAIFPGQAGSVVINEIYWGGSDGDGLDEWIELRNMTSTPINLANWVVENLGLGGPNANVSITSGTIPGNGFFLIARKNKDDSKRNIEEDFLVTVSLDNGGEQLVLKNDDGVIIDTANDSGDWFAGTSASPKKSMERNDTPSDGTVSTNWHSATAQTNMDADRTELASPKAANSAP